MRIVYYGFILLVVYELLVYHKGGVALIGAFSGAVVQESYAFTGRDASGKPSPYAGG